MKWEFGISRYKLSHVGWINSKILCSAWELYTISSGKPYVKECVEEYIYIHTCITGSLSVK